MKLIVLYFPVGLHSMLYIAVMPFLQFHLVNDASAEVLQMSEFYKLYSCYKILKSCTYSGRLNECFHKSKETYFSGPQSQKI